MGFAERSNPRSEWNKKRMGNTDNSLSVQTTDKKHLVTAPNPSRTKDEPMVMELTLKNIWGYLCRMLLFQRRPSPAPTS